MKNVTVFKLSGSISCDWKVWNKLGNSQPIWEQEEEGKVCSPLKMVMIDRAVVAHAFNSRQRQADLCEFKASQS